MSFFVHFIALFSRPMLVPFGKDIGGMVRKPITEILEYLASINANPDYSQGTLWKCLQIELLLQKIFWGQIFKWRLDYNTWDEVKQISVNIGPGENRIGRSQTDSLGFMALNDWTETITLQSTLPPFSIWTRQQRQVSLIFFILFESMHLL